MESFVRIKDAQPIVLQLTLDGIGTLVEKSHHAKSVREHVACETGALKLNTTNRAEPIAAYNDPQFGSTVMFGLRGIFVEILKDVSLRVAPLTCQDALEMIKEIKEFELLAGAPGQAKADIHAIADVLAKVTCLALELEDHVAELDINPLLVLSEGQAVCVEDTLLITK